MLRSSVVRFGTSAAAAALIIMALASSSTDARSGGHGGGHGGFSHGGGIGGVSHGFSIGRSVRSAPVMRSFSRPLTAHSITSRRITRSANITTPRKLQTGSITANKSLISRQAGIAKNVGGAQALHNSTFASLARNPNSKALAKATFQGGLAQRHLNLTNTSWNWLHRRPIIVIGWFGPLFWPFAYWDFIDYMYWPYAYDVFWPYAYDDLYVGMFGPYAYQGLGATGTRISRRTRAIRPGSTAAIVCGERVPALTDWPIMQIAQTVQPDQMQEAALNDLKDGAAKALNTLQSACPDDLPSTPPGRVAAMHKRVESMLAALGAVQPPLQRFYDSLSDEQKARFNAVMPEPAVGRTARRRTAAANAAPDLTEVCNPRSAKALDVPRDRLEREIRLTDAQRAAHDALNDATMRAADLLSARCSTDQTFTPPGRVMAMEQRLNAILDAIKIVQPALDNFYGSLSDEQKARFNQLGTQPQG